MSLPAGWRPTGPIMYTGVIKFFRGLWPDHVPTCVWNKVPPRHKGTRSLVIGPSLLRWLAAHIEKLKGRVHYTCMGPANWWTEHASTTEGLSHSGWAFPADVLTPTPVTFSTLNFWSRWPTAAQPPAKQCVRVRVRAHSAKHVEDWVRNT